MNSKIHVPKPMTFLKIRKIFAEKSKWVFKRTICRRSYFLFKPSALFPVKVNSTYSTFMTVHFLFVGPCILNNSIDDSESILAENKADGQNKSKIV